MRQITNITADAKQNFEIILDDNSLASLTLEFMDSQGGWRFSVTRNNFTVNGRNLVSNVNLLRQFKNYIPFGLAVISKDKLDPAFLEDFITERISLYVLNETDVQFIEGNIYAR